jgi:thiol-disulfide isomerase/thioredoxin
MKTWGYLVVGVLALWFYFHIYGGKGVGDPLPDADLEYLGPKPSLIGSPLLVEFWATWCGPCRQSIPHLNDLHARYGPRGLIILGVTKEQRGTVEDFRKQVKMDYPVAIDPSGSLGRQLGVSGIPHSFLVDRMGKIVWRGHPMSLPEEEIQKIL